MIISHTFETGTSLKEKREYLYFRALDYLVLNDYSLDYSYADSCVLLLGSLINLRLKGAKCSIEFTEEYKRD